MFLPRRCDSGRYFDNGIEASPGCSTGGGDPITYGFTKNEGSTTSRGTGPSAGVGGSGPYVYAETSDKKKCKINKTTCNRNARLMTRCKKQCKKDKKKKKLCQKTFCELGFAV